MSEQRYQSFAEFWPYYVREHSHPACRLLHFVGSTLGIVVLAAAVVYNLWLLPLALVVGYGFAWIGHFWSRRTGLPRSSILFGRSLATGRCGSSCSPVE